MQSRALDEARASGEFRLLLQQEFVNRCKKNPRYSLRAFAKSLSIEPSPLSAILRGKRPLTEKMKKRLGLALGMSPNAISRFNAKPSNGPQYQQLTLDTFAIISDWYHYAILELTKLKTFKPNVQYIARALSISATEAQIAVERLQRVGLLEIQKNGKWIDASKDGYATNIDGNLTSHASRTLQRQVLEMAIRSLESDPIDMRNHTSMTMAIDPKDLPEARERIKVFRRDMCAFLERAKSLTHVYNLGIALYPISRLEN